MKRFIKLFLTGAGSPEPGLHLWGARLAVWPEQADGLEIGFASCGEALQASRALGLVGCCGCWDSGRGDSLWWLQRGDTLAGDVTACTTKCGQFVASCNLSSSMPAVKVAGCHGAPRFTIVLHRQNILLRLDCGGAVNRSSLPTLSVPRHFASHYLRAPWCAPL